MLIVLIYRNFIEGCIDLYCSSDHHLKKVLYHFNGCQTMN